MPATRTPNIPHTTLYYLKCVGGGILSCGLTHTAICPLDVVKCNRQVNPEQYKGLIQGASKAKNNGKGFGQIASEFGYSNLLTKGLGTRIIIIGTLTGLQWWIYDSYKVAMGLGSSGGGAAKK
jgi:hypothetical protein